MQISKTKLNQEIKKQIDKIFCQTIADLKRKEDVEIFIRDFFTKTEKSVMTKRLAVAMFLEKGRSYEQIKKSLKVSSATIASVDKMMNKNSEGFVLALRRIEAEEWAGKLAKRITAFFKKL
jgi:TrpR-related protein YerC/YecD